MTVFALIVAAGRGTRAGPGAPKQYRAIGDAPMLRRTVEAFATCDMVDRVRVVIHPDDIEAYEAAVGAFGLPAPAFGGATRQESVRLGLEALGGAETDVVLIHDAARPFVEKDLIGRVLEAVREHRAACPSLPVTDTIRLADDGIAGETLDRSRLVRAQTPQGFLLGPIRAAHESMRDEVLTDDVAVAQAAGMTVALVDGSEANVKMTTRDDFEALAAKDGAEATETRTGSGFDVHAFGPGDHVTLCGVTVPFDRGLNGHSDADVGMHALTDAVFGAIAEGDIGRWFPPSDDQWKGAASEIFLRKAAERVARRGAVGS